MSAARVRVVAALIPHPAQAGQFLIQQRLPGHRRGLLWEFPGGKVEPGESDAAALIRECREELAVEIEVGRAVWTTVHRYEDLEVELVLHAARILRGAPKALGAHALRFATPEQMQALPFCEADVPLLWALAKGQVS